MYRPNVSTVVVAMGRQRHLVVVVRRWGRWVVCWRLGGGSRWVECSPAHWGWGTWRRTHWINVRRRFLNVGVILLSDPLKTDQHLDRWAELQLRVVDLVAPRVLQLLRRMLPALSLLLVEILEQQALSSASQW